MRQQGATTQKSQLHSGRHENLKSYLDLNDWGKSPMAEFVNMVMKCKNRGRQGGENVDFTTLRTWNITVNLYGEAESSTGIASRAPLPPWRRRQYFPETLLTACEFPQRHNQEKENRSCWSGSTQAGNPWTTSQFRVCLFRNTLHHKFRRRLRHNAVGSVNCASYLVSSPCNEAHSGPDKLLPTPLWQIGSDTRGRCQSIHLSPRSIWPVKSAYSGITALRHKNTARHGSSRPMV
jgi:hypothetical protein